ncbi:MAG: hypothetical protein FWH26_06405 [Oscillospiraceae bacterium]|nr:hypothetical protein [Oscillospiraceae bacterium]
MKIKRLIAAMLVALLLTGSFVLPAGAAKGCGCGEVLQVWVDGFGQSLYYHEGTPEEQLAGMVKTDGLLCAVPPVLAGVVKTALTGSWDPFARGLGDLVFRLLGHLRLDEEGNSVEPISSSWKIDPEQDHKTDPEFWFDYDFRMDFFDIAAQLNEFIETLCEETGHKKIALTGHSEGTNVIMTYLKEYGTKRLDSFLLVNGGWQGLTMAGQLFNKQLSLSGPAITNFISNYDSGDGVLKAAMDLTRAAELLFFAPAVGEFLRRELLDPVFAEVLVPLFCQMPAVWGFIPPEYYEGAKAVLGDDPKYDALKVKLDEYHYGVMRRADVLLKRARKAGVTVAVITSYGPAPIPVSRDSFYHCDALIDTARAAGGATAARFGETLPESDSKYRSPDGVFDAASCLLPDNTWFVKYNNHSPHASEELRMWIIHSKNPDVWKNPAFPQYLKRVEENGRLRSVPLTAADIDPASPDTVPEAAKNLAKALWDKIA